MKLRAAGLTAAAALVAVAPGAVADPWSAPRTVSAPHTFVGPLHLSGAADAQLALWRWQDGLGADASAGDTAAGRPRDGSFGPERSAARDVVGLATYGRTRAIALTQQQVGGPGALTRFRLAVAFGRADTGAFGPLRTLAVAPVAYLAQLDYDYIGIVAWIEHTSHRRRAVRVSTRLRGDRAFSRPYTLSGRGQADVLAAAANRHGDVAIVFVRNDRLLARVRRAGHHWGSILELARADGATRWQVRAAIDSHGRVEAVWRRHQIGRDGHRAVRSIEAAYMPAGHFTWRGPQIVEPDGAGTPALARAPEGFVVAYAEDAAGGALPRVRIAAPRFGGPLDAGPARGGLRGVEVAPGGWGLLATWVQPQAGGDGDGQGFGAFRPAGGAFGPVEAVTPSENVHELHAVGDEGYHGYLAAWTARPEGSGPSVPVSRIRTVVRTARRSEVGPPP